MRFLQAEQIAPLSRESDKHRVGGRGGSGPIIGVEIYEEGILGGNGVVKA